MTAEQSPTSRAEEYAMALEYYSTLGREVHFLENSAFLIEGHERLSSALGMDNVYLHRFSPSTAFEKGKGYQEFEMLDRFINESGTEFSSYMKVSGRYRCENIERLIKEWDVQNGLHMMLDRHKKMKVAITGVFACKTRFHVDTISGIYRQADDTNGRFIEHVLYDVLKNADKGIAMFPINPVLKGISGSSGASLGRNPWKMRLRNIERRLLELSGSKEFKIEY